MVRKIVLGCLLTAQVTAGAAAELTPDPNAAAARSGAGGFAGLRLRVETGPRPAVSAGLALAPMTRSGDGRAIGFRTGGGFEYGLTNGSERPVLSIAGRPATAVLRAQDDADDEPKDEKRNRGPSTLGWIGIGAAVAVVGALAGFAILVSSIEGE